MRSIRQIKIRSIRVITYALCFVLATISLSLLINSKASADVSINGPYDCNTNSVLYCGAANTTNLVNKYYSGDGLNSSKSIEDIYSYFGVTSQDIAILPANAVIGKVTSSGRVYVGNKLVAINAVTGGRDFIPGSTQVISSGTSFYTRTPSVSFLNTPLSAYVVMNGNKFEYAILSSCGNPVMAMSTYINILPSPSSPTVPPSQITLPPKPTQTLLNTGVNTGITISVFIGSLTISYLLFLAYLKIKQRRTFIA